MPARPEGPAYWRWRCPTQLGQYARYTAAILQEFFRAARWSVVLPVLLAVGEAAGIGEQRAAT